MNTSPTITKSPLKKMFSSVFKREDIHLSQNTPIRKCPSNPTPLKPSVPVKILSSQNYPTARSSTPMLYKTYLDENQDPKNPISDPRYEDLLKKYERMQEFYKSQLWALADEVDHYKSLYQKVMKYKEHC